MLGVFQAPAKLYYLLQYLLAHLLRLSPTAPAHVHDSEAEMFFREKCTKCRHSMHPSAIVNHETIQ